MSPHWCKYPVKKLAMREYDKRRTGYPDKK